MNISEVQGQNNYNIKILIATHKKYWMPSDSMYVPLQVGRARKKDLGYIGDDTDDNISVKNEKWSELTGLYWGWKNMKCDYMGLVHYRRHFMYRYKKDRYASILTTEQAKKLLAKADIVLPRKRNYRIMTLEEHFREYDITCDSDMEVFYDAIHRLSPEYDNAFHKVMSRRSGHMCNMFIMKKELLDTFCNWEFPILEEIERNIKDRRSRLIGYMAEHMLDVWIEKNGIPYVECSVISLEPRNEFDRRIDYLMRKLRLRYRRIKRLE